MRKSKDCVITLGLLCGLMCSCEQVAEGTSPSGHVTIQSVNGKYHLYVKGEPFTVKGVGMGGVGDGSRIRALKEAGGNSLRTWSSRNGQALLDAAADHGLMVAMGLSMGKELHHFDYDDNVAVKEQFERIKTAVDQFKDHPQLLCWVAGNELNLLFDESGGLKPVNPKTYQALKDIVDYIHNVDPHHPVTTTFAGVQKASIELALKHCPDLDFLSYQVYGGLGQIPEQVATTGILKPYMITEFGPVGHWERPATEWGREIEETSTEKAIGLRKRIQKAFLADSSGLNMGGFAFLWGQKQERTPTWYGLFNKSGEATASVDELTKFWTGSYPANRAPSLESMRLDGKQAVDNIYLKSNAEYSAKVVAADPNGDELNFKWVIMKEVVERSQGGAREIEPDEVTCEVVAQENGDFWFVSPTEPGEYRLFSYVYDGKGKVGNANIPFYVKE